MKRRRNIRSKIIMEIICVLALVLATVSTHAWAQCATLNPTEDADMDGFLNEVECTYLTFLNSSTIQSCEAMQGPFCLNPVSKDLFVILNKATPTYMPVDTNNPLNTAYPLMFFYRDHASGGLGINTLIIEDCIQASCTDTPASDRIINPAVTQKAVRVTESLDPNTGDVGSTQFGTPNDKDFSKVYTQRIINEINSACANATECKDSTTPCSGLSDCIQKLEEKYIKQVTAHELGHTVYLVPTYDRRFGYHYAPGSGTVMEKSVKYTSKGGKVTFYLSDKFAQPADINGLRMK